MAIAYNYSYGYEKLVFDFGEGVRAKTTTSKDGSRCENCPMLIQRDS